VHVETITATASPHGIVLSSRLGCSGAKKGAKNLPLEEGGKLFVRHFHQAVGFAGPRAANRRKLI
jgi:hypothetical protein